MFFEIETTGYRIYNLQVVTDTKTETEMRFRPASRGTGRFLFGRRVRTIQLQLGSSLKLVCAEALVAVRLETRGRRGVQMTQGNENAAAHLRVCSAFMLPLLASAPMNYASHLHPFFSSPVSILLRSTLSGSPSNASPKIVLAILFLVAGLVLQTGLTGQRSAAAQQPTEEVDRSHLRPTETEMLKRRLRKENQSGMYFRKELTLLGAASGPHPKKVSANLVTRAAAGLTGVEGSSTSIADVNGDGSQDLLISGNAGSGPEIDPTTTLYLGGGDGTFEEANVGLMGVSSSSVSIADVDNDENRDLLVVGLEENAGCFSVLTATLYLGNGQGDFSEADAGLTGVTASSTSIADVNGDGSQDILITGDPDPCNIGDQTTTLYLGDGQGNFSEAGAGLTDVGGGSSSIADVDGDGNQDLLINGTTREFDGFGRRPGRKATLYLGDGQGGFSEADAGLTGTNGSTSIEDIDGDGDLDLLITGLDALFAEPSARIYSLFRTGHQLSHRASATSGP